MSSAAERATWKALAEADGLMQGPWEAKMVQPDMGGLHQYRIGNPRRPTPLNSVRMRADDAEFIAAARTAVPALLADVERLERELHICGLARDLANEESIQLEAENRRLREADL